MATFHPTLPRGARVKTQQVATLEEILTGPAHENDGTFNLFGALATSMATTGYATIREFQKAELVVAPSIKSEGKTYQTAHASGWVTRGVASVPRRPVLVVDLGAQYAQLIARRIRECHVYSEIVAHDLPATELAARRPAGIVLSGGPASVYEVGAPALDPAVFELGVPVLGICYGHQLMAQTLGARSRRRGGASTVARNST
jgi:carbamoylphosphate synthase small subunit